MSRALIRNYRSGRRDLPWSRSLLGALIGNGMVLPTRSQLFGSAAAVFHYNASSRPMGSLFTRLFGIPPIGFPGDYGFITFTGVLAESTAEFKEPHHPAHTHRSAVELADAKYSIGTTNNSLGLKEPALKRERTHSRPLRRFAPRSAKMGLAYRRIRKTVLYRPYCDR